jgi:hypothetical protein
MKEYTITHDPEDDWVEVELSRWQTGKLPDENSPLLDISLALKNIANNIENSVKNKNMEDMITPFNLCSVLRYLAKFNYE